MTTPAQTADPAAELHSRLAAYRTTLMDLLLRLSITGIAYASPEMVLAIHKARADIRQVKAELRSMGVEPGDHPDDEE